MYMYTTRCIYVRVYVCMRVALLSDATLSSFAPEVWESPNKTKAVFAVSKNYFAMGWMFIACSRKCNLSAPVAAFPFSINVLKQYSQ